MGTSNAHKQAMAENGRRVLLNNQLKYNKNPKLCECCSEPIPYEKRNTNKFCSNSCSAAYNNHRRGQKKLKKCLYCGKELFGRRTKQYCNNRCQRDFHREKTKKDWYENGNSPGLRYIKTILFEDRGSKCEVCGITEWNGMPISFEIDHIDGNYMNNSPENLRIICPNCHSQTDTYKAKNKGKGRHYRRARYSEGKSY